MPYGITVLPATWQRWHAWLYPTQLKVVLYLATLEGCKAELTYLAWFYTKVVYQAEDGRPSQYWPTNDAVNKLDVVTVDARYTGVSGRANTVCSNAPHGAVAPAVACTSARWEDGVISWSEWTHTGSEDNRTRLLQLPTTRFLSCTYMYILFGSYSLLNIKPPYVDTGANAPQKHCRFQR